VVTSLITTLEVSLLQLPTILWLQIAMKNALVMAVADSDDDLRK
jgi:hypothetical protein